MKACMPSTGMFLDRNASSKGDVPEEAPPPGSYRVILREEWGDFLEE